MKRAMIYCRVSTEEQGDNYSLSSQEEACRRYAEQNSFTVVATMHDMMSGAKLERPSLSLIRERVRAQAIDAVIVYSSDRLTRSVAHAMLLRDEMRSAGVALHTVARGKSQDSPEGGLMETIEAAFAEYERLKIAERMRRGQRQRVVSGLSHGNKLPFGYRYSDASRTKIIIDEEEATVVRMIFGWYLAESIGTLQIANRLTDLQIPSPADRQAYFAVLKKREHGHWSQSSVIAILNQSGYKGELHSRLGNETFITEVPPIVSTDDWFRAAQLRAERFRLSRRNARQLYILRTRVFCGRCGSSCVGSHGGRKFHYYRCIGITKPSANKTKCHLPQFRDIYLEEQVWAWLCGEVLNEERIRAAIAGLDDQTEGARTLADAERTTIARQLENLEAQARRLMDLYTTGVFSLEEIAAQKVHLDQARASCRTAIAQLDERIAGMVTARQRADDLCELVRAARSRLDQLTPEERYKIINLLDVSVTLNYEGEAGRGKHPKRFANVVCNLTFNNIRLWVQGDSNETTTPSSPG